jgi:hypothetical protein
MACSSAFSDALDSQSTFQLTFGACFMAGCFGFWQARFSIPRQGLATVGVVKFLAFLNRGAFRA